MNTEKQPPRQNSRAQTSHAEIDDSITLRQEASGFGAMLRTQPFWVFVAILTIGVVMTFVSDAFLTERNLFNITRNFAFFGIMALGMSAVICTAGIDLSVGSLVGLSGISLALVLQAGWGLEFGFLACMLSAMAVGLINGVLIAYVRLAPFVVTLGMLAIARSIAMVMSNNKMIYRFGPDQELFEWVGGGSIIGVPNVVWVLIAMIVLFWWVWRYSTWGRWVIAIGGNPQAARLAGIPVERVVVSVYVVCSLCTGIAAFMFIGYTGSATNAMGTTWELNVIAASVIGGANLMGGVVYAVGAPIGAALVELIRNSLLLAGIPALWQQFFVGLFLILAVLLEQIRNRGGKWLPFHSLQIKRRNTMKKLLIATALVGLLAPSAAMAADYTFALVPKAMNNPFFDLARDGCYKAQEELDDVTCEYIGPGEHTELEQVQIVQDLITKGVDGIAVSPSNAPAIAKVLKAATDAGIPVMTWDADLLDEDKGLRTTFVGTHNYQIGVNLAKLVQARHADGGTICLQTGGAAAANHNERLKGARDTLAGRDMGEAPGSALNGEGGWTEVSACPLITNDDGNVAVQGMTDILAANPDLTAFLSTGAFTMWFDNAYRNAASPYKDRMAAGELTIVVADTLPMQIEQTKDGLGNGLVGQRPFEMGYRAMYILKDIVEGKSVEDPIYTGLDVCDNDNIDSCVQ